MPDALEIIRHARQHQADVLAVLLVHIEPVVTGERLLVGVGQARIEQSANSSTGMRRISRISRNMAYCIVEKPMLCQFQMRRFSRMSR